MESDENQGWGSYLTKELIPDLKHLLISKQDILVSYAKKKLAKKFSRIPELYAALRAGEVTDSQWVSLQCKPSGFGPYLRRHFLSVITGNKTGLRLGPQLVSKNLALAVIGQVTTHLKPVGLYPPVDEDRYQINLYSSDASAVGFVSVFLIGDVIPRLPAISAARHLVHGNKNCQVTGVIRLADPSLMGHIGIAVEQWEELKQKEAVWFLDLTHPLSEVEPHDGKTSEIWGGLYASGHLEIIEGTLPVRPLVDGLADSMRTAGFEPHVLENKGKGAEISVFAKGIRAQIGTQFPLYSIHMDAEVGVNYARYRKTFNQVTDSYLSVIEEVANASSVQLGNPNDLDFTYTDSAVAFSVLKSEGADLIADPVGIAVRDWHRKRNTK